MKKPENVGCMYYRKVLYVNGSYILLQGLANITGVKSSPQPVRKYSLIKYSLIKAQLRHLFIVYDCFVQQRP